jgi:broad specificity phosphatase PhoE
MSRPLLYLVRHGETDWNAQGRLQGRRETPLNAVGLRQAEEAGRRLRDLVPDAAGLDFVGSPMERARRTMAIVREALGLDPEAGRLDDRLKEIAFGAWEGSTWKELRARDPRAVAARERDLWGFTPPGEGAESYRSLAARVGPLIDALERPTVVVSHGGVARAILAHAGLVEPEKAPRVEIWQGRVLVVEGDGWRWA